MTLKQGGWILPIFYSRITARGKLFLQILTLGYSQAFLVPGKMTGWVADMKSNNEQSEYWYVWPKLKPAIINLIKKYKIKIIKKD